VKKEAGVEFGMFADVGYLTAEVSCEVEG